MVCPAQILSQSKGNPQQDMTTAKMSQGYLHQKKTGLALFSQKMGLGAGLGLQEYMANVNSVQED